MENTFGNRIRELRTERGLLMREVAAKLEIDVSILSKIERNHRNANKELIIKFAKLYKIDEKELFTLWYADKIAEQLINEKNVDEILRMVILKLNILKNEN